MIDSLLADVSQGVSDISPVAGINFGTVSAYRVQVLDRGWRQQTGV